ncbi:MAG: hypothetical protein FWE82_00235 [Defluviitaleaceae bacterium]|nr:hypothetical protein [Defluviitaleaceae bacterium]
MTKTDKSKLFKIPDHLIINDGSDIGGVATEETLMSRIEHICAKINNPVNLICFYDYEKKKTANLKKMKTGNEPKNF